MQENFYKVMLNYWALHHVCRVMVVINRQPLVSQYLVPETYRFSRTSVLKQADAYIRPTFSTITRGSSFQQMIAQTIYFCHDLLS